MACSEGVVSMNEQEAQSITEAIGGSAWNSGGGIYLVRIKRQDGHLVVISDEVVCEYASEEEFDNNNPLQPILLR